MSVPIFCTLMVLAAPAAHALGRDPRLHQAATAAHEAAQGLHAAAELPLPISAGPTRGLLTRELRSRKPKASPSPRARKSRGKRDPVPKRTDRKTHKPSSTRGRRARGSTKGGSATKVPNPVDSTKGSRKAGPGSASKSPGKRKTGAQIKSESLCAKHVVEKEVVRSKPATAHVSAIEEVFATACLEGSDIDMKVFQEVFMTADAFVFSQTISKAIVTCKSDDEDAYECATVTASADAYARATASAHAEAVAAAVNACGCMSEAVSESISSESVYIRLIAEAASTATATACIKGKGRVRASAYDKCSSKVYGKVFARAVSEAIVKGSCMNAEAVSRVLTEASGKFDTSSTCGLTADAIAVDPPASSK